MVSVGEAFHLASPTPCFLGRPQGLGSAPWLGEGRRSPREVGWAGGALEPVEEGQPDGPGDSGVLRWVSGKRVVAWGGHCVQGDSCGPVTLLGTGTRGMALVHTACGRSESKHLRPTPAGHAEGCSVIALCWPGSPRQAGCGPVSCDSGPSGLATQHWVGALGTGSPPPQPQPQPHFSPLATLKILPLLGTVWPGAWGSLPLLHPALQPGGGVEVGGASGPRGT